jgi:hypothetical protein
MQLGACMKEIFLLEKIKILITTYNWNKVYHLDQEQSLKKRMTSSKENLKREYQSNLVSLSMLMVTFIRDSLKTVCQMDRVKWFTAMEKPAKEILKMDLQMV